MKTLQNQYVDLWRASFEPVFFVVVGVFFWGVLTSWASLRVFKGG